MATKIMLFLSNMRENQKEETYQCPDGSEVRGTQTNEAPVRYLLNAYPRVSEVLCIVTPEARKSAWEHFQTELQIAAPSACVREIPLKENENFVTEVLPRVMEQVKAGDEILLDTTGGLRDTVMYLLLLSRVLSYVKIKTVCAVYSNYAEKTIKDVSHLIGLFDLVGGMQELTSFGSAKTLRAFYGAQPKDGRIAALLTAVEELMESIALCRTRQLDERMTALEEALNEAASCGDPLMCALIPAFRAKFGKKMSAPGLIKWCVESDMLQQALTVYTERIPAYIIGRGDLLTVDENVQGPDVRDYQDPNAVLFTEGFLHLYRTPENLLRAYLLEKDARGKNKNTNTILYFARNKSASVPAEIEKGVQNLALICRLAYPGPEKTFQADWTKKLPESKRFLRALESFFAEKKPVTVFKFLNTASTLGPNLSAVLLEKKDMYPQNEYVLTLEHLEEAVAGSGFHLHCPAERMADIARDYLYIKTLRNTTNHANGESTSDQKPLLEYLNKKNPDHIPPEEVTSAHLKTVLLRALERLKPVS